MSESQVSVGAALGYAWSLWRSHWREIWGVLALNAVAWTVLYAGVFAQDWRLMAAANIGLIFTVFATYGAVVRLAFGAEHPNDPEFRLGGLGLQWRKMELRMLGANLLLAVFLSIIVLLLAVAVTAPLLGVLMSKSPTLPTTPAELERALGPTGVQLANLAYVAVWLVTVFIITRLSLYLVATGDRKRVSLLRTWKLTRGCFWRIFAATLVLGLPTVLIMSMGFGTDTSLNGQPAPLGPGETFIYSLVCGGWAGAAAMPMTAAVQAYFYRNLKVD